jgi:hypothetical protein
MQAKREVMKKMIFSLVAVAMVAVAGVNVYKVSASEVEMSDLQKENVEALAENTKKKQGYLCCTSCDGKCDYGNGDVFKGYFQY